MSEVISYIHQSNIHFTYRSTTPETQSIVPRLCVDIDIQHTAPAGVNVQPIDLSIINSEFKIISKKGAPIYSSILIPSQLLYIILPTYSTTARLYTELDPYKLTQIEKLREGGDLQCQVELRFVAETYTTVDVTAAYTYPQQAQQHSIKQTIKQTGMNSLSLRIPKSDWVEKILPQLGFRNVSLIEISKIDKSEFSDIVSKINEAWKQYSMGEYDKVLVECRKSMEELTALIKNRGFQKEIVEEGNKKTVPDWEKVLGHEKMGDFIRAFVQKLFGFLALGAHHGKSINREDAELAIMYTHALVNFIARKI